MRSKNGTPRLSGAWPRFARDVFRGFQPARFSPATRGADREAGRFPSRSSSRVFRSPRLLRAMRGWTWLGFSRRSGSCRRSHPSVSATVVTSGGWCPQLSRSPISLRDHLLGLAVKNLGCRRDPPSPPAWLLENSAVANRTTDRDCCWHPNHACVVEGLSCVELTPFPNCHPEHADIFF